MLGKCKITDQLIEVKMKNYLSETLNDKFILELFVMVAKSWVSDHPLEKKCFNVRKQKYGLCIL